MRRRAHSSASDERSAARRLSCRQKQLRAALWVSLGRSANNGNTGLARGYGVYYEQSPLAPSEARYFNRHYFDFSLFFPLPVCP